MISVYKSCCYSSFMLYVALTPPPRHQHPRCFHFSSNHSCAIMTNYPDRGTTACVCCFHEKTPGFFTDSNQVSYILVILRASFLVILRTVRDSHAGALYFVTLQASLLTLRDSIAYCLSNHAPQPYFFKALIHLCFEAQPHKG